VGVTINSLERLEGYDDRHSGSIEHNGHAFDAVIVGPFEKLRSIRHASVTAEYELNEIISVETDLAKDDSISGFFSLTDNQIAVDGSVHNEIKVDDLVSVFDIYIQNGADFLSLTTEQLGCNPRVGSRIRIVGAELLVYPTFT